MKCKTHPHFLGKHETKKDCLACTVLFHIGLMPQSAFENGAVSIKFYDGSELIPRQPVAVVA
jgi:hypothetical protein